MLEDKILKTYCNLLKDKKHESTLINFWEFIWSSYNNKNRHYHNSKHIKSMISFYEENYDKFPSHNNKVVYFSILFHDIVYEAGQPFNEDSSRDLAELFLTAVDESDIIPKVTQAIMSTQYEKPKEKLTIETLILLDLDLKILSADYNIFKEFDANIKKEYSAIDDVLFTNGRRSVLIDFLNKGIYNTEFMKTYESLAKENLNKIIAEKYPFTMEV